MTHRHEGARWRVGTFAVPVATLSVGINLDRTARELNQARYAFLLGLPVGLLLIGAGGFLLAQRALRPVQALREMAERVTAKGLDERLELRGSEDEEFQRLIDVFNGMLDRLQRSFAQANSPR